MKKITALTIGISLLLGMLSGCSGGSLSDEQVDLVDVKDLNNFAVIPAVNFTENSENSGGDSGGSGNSGNPENRENSENSETDNSEIAEINIPKTAEYIEGIAEFSLFEPEKVKTALFGDADITPEIIDYNDDRYPHPLYIWEKDGMELYINNNSMTVDLSSAFTLMLDHLAFLPNYNYDGDIGEFEHNADELDFCSREQAVKTVGEKLAEFGVNVSENADVYAVCQSDLQKKINERIAENDLVDFNDYMKGAEEPKLITSYTADKSQECYIIVFNAEYNGVPIYNYQFHYLTIKDLTIFHPEIKVIYSADGIIGLSIAEYRAKITEEEKITALISAETASQKVKEKYEDIAEIENLVFDKVELMYTIAPNYIDGKVNISKAKLIPAWVCTVYVSKNGPNKRTGRDEITVDKDTILIDARTGEEII